jgi:hypothetical protein
MNTPDDSTLVTAERKLRGNVRIAARTVSGGGNVSAMGQVDDWHHYLDFLHDKGMLGSEPTASRRRDNGLKFFELYVRTHASQKSNIKDPSPGGQAGEGPTHLADIGTPADKLQTEWLLTCRYLQRHLKFLDVYCTMAAPPAKPMEMSEIAKLRDLDRARALALHCVHLADVSRHLRAFSLVRDVLFPALDAIPEAMERAHDEAWPKEERR